MPADLVLKGTKGTDFALIPLRANIKRLIVIIYVHTTDLEFASFSFLKDTRYNVKDNLSQVYVFSSVCVCLWVCMCACI